MKYSEEFGPRGEPSFPPKGKFYHVTPTPNVQGINDNGLVRGVIRTTNGVETQKKIYLTTSFWGIDNIFPAIEGWQHKDMSVYEVDLEGFRPMAESDPEYDNDTFYMVDADIPVERLSALGRIEFFEYGGKYYGKLPPKEFSPVHESIRKSGDEWEVTDSSGKEVLGTHPSKKKAMAQLAAIEISKMKNEHDEPLPKYAAATKVGIYSYGKVTGYGYEFPDGSIDINGLKFPDRFVALSYGYEVSDLAPGYEEMKGRHFHARV